MDCREVSGLADDYVFGLLEPSVEGELTAHVGSCRDCAKIVEEAHSRRRLFSAWEVGQPTGAADRLLARTRTGEVKRQAATMPLFLRIMAAAAVILAAVVLPRIFMVEPPPVVLGYVPQITVDKGTLQDSAAGEFNIPENFAESACLIIHLKSGGEQSAVKAAIRLNESKEDVILTGATASEEMYLLTHEHGLRAGDNTVVIKNLGSAPLDFEVTLVMKPDEQ